MIVNYFKAIMLIWIILGDSSLYGKIFVSNFKLVGTFFCRTIFFNLNNKIAVYCFDNDSLIQNN
jgi:hypothetical protein